MTRDEARAELERHPAKVALVAGVVVALGCGSSSHRGEGLQDSGGDPSAVATGGSVSVSATSGGEDGATGGRAPTTGGSGPSEGGSNSSEGGSSSSAGGSGPSEGGSSSSAGGSGPSVGGSGPSVGGSGPSVGGSGNLTGGRSGSGGASGTGGRSFGSGGRGGASGGAGTGGTADAGTGGGTSDGSGGTSDGSGGTNTGGGSAGSDELCDVGVWDRSTPQPLTLSGNTFAHDPTMIEANGVFYRFWTGDHVPSATSTDLTHWVDAPTVYRNGYSSWTSEWLGGIPGEQFGFPWAPDVSYFNGEYHLYSTFSAVFGDNISCIAHLTTSDLAAGSWTDHGPIICTTGSESYNAIDADAGTDVDGNPYLAFGSFWDGIMAIPLQADGSRLGTEMTRLAWADQIEAPVLFRRCGYYYLFVSWGLCCPGEGRSVEQLSYRVAVGRADHILGPYYDRDGRAMLDGGGTLVVEGDGATWAAAGHSDVIVSGDTIYHLYHAYRQSNGEAQLRIVELPFDDEGWPVPGGP